ncbi:Leucine-rich repeat [Sergentomyia squamirostris]
MSVNIMNRSILTVNDDCLLHVYSFLDNDDVINMEKVCTRFEYIANRFYKTYKIVDLKSNYEWDEEIFEHLAPKVGSHAHTHTLIAEARVTSFHVRGRVIKPLLCHFTNLAHLHLEGVKKLTEYFEIMKIIFVKLRTAVLVNCGLEGDISDWIKDATQLKVLKLGRNQQLNGNFLLYLQNLKEFNIKDCDNIKACNFPQFCERNQTLESLNIHDWENLTQECVDAIAKYLKDLEKLMISVLESNCFMNFDALADLPKLNHLRLNGIEMIKIDSFIELLAQHDQLEYLDIFLDSLFALCTLIKFKKLKVLYLIDCLFSHLDAILQVLQCKDTLEEVYLSNSFVTDRGVIFLIENCPNLKKINLRGCFRITDTLMMELSHLTNRTQPLKIYVQYTEIDRSVASDLNLNDNPMLDIEWYTDSENEELMEDETDVTLSNSDGDEMN